MGLNVYQKVVEIIGEVPSNLEFLYVIGTILLLLVIIFVCVSPWVMIWRLIK